ncbi:MAG: hypothetical protein OEW19_15925 [Acidobacteriota bacterium]|nr:hypothetical protein [Acidobacteriota bacterium]
MSILFGCIESWQTARDIGTMCGVTMWRGALAMAGVVGLLGLVPFLTVLLRIS